MQPHSSPFRAPSPSPLFFKPLDYGPTACEGRDTNNNHVSTHVYYGASVSFPTAATIPTEATASAATPTAASPARTPSSPWAASSRTTTTTKSSILLLRPPPWPWRRRWPPWQRTAKGPLRPPTCCRPRTSPWTRRPPPALRRRTAAAAAREQREVSTKERRQTDCFAGIESITLCRGRKEEEGWRESGMGCHKEGPALN